MFEVSLHLLTVITKKISLMKKTTSAFFAACVLLAVSCGQTQQKSTQNDNVTYETLEVTLSDRVLTTSYPAAINGVQTVEIRPQVSGMITDILIEEGESVTKNQVLFIIDQTPWFRHSTTRISLRRHSSLT